MFLPPQRRRSNGRFRRARTERVPAPRGGLNKLDDLTSVKPEEAIVLDNLIPTTNGAEVRNGRESHVTGISGNIISLMTFFGNDGSDTIFAANSAAIYDVTSAGSVGAAVQSSLSNGNWRGINFANASGNYLYICNGADAVRYYNGSSWTSPTISGVTSSDIVNVHEHMSRIWLIEKDSLSAWYLGVDAVAGTATEFNLGPFSKEGGYLVAMGSWTVDGGEGLDDVAIFITSEGEVHVYSGTDPSSASTWGRVGTYKIAPPIGYDCVKSFGSDLGILTTEGVVSLTAVQGLSVSAQNKGSITNKIRGDVYEQFKTIGAVDGWQFFESSEHGLFVVNVPVTDGVTYYQYVMNTRETGRWGRFKGINTKCWGKANGSVYFGGLDGTVYQYSGYTDDGDAIECVAVHGFDDYGTSNEKGFKRYRPQFKGPAGYSALVGIRLDYDEADILESITPPASTGPYWDEVYWDEEYWAEENVVSKKWYGLKGAGHVGAVSVKFSTKEYIRYDGGLIEFETHNAR